MYKVMDVKEELWNGGCQVDIENYYLVRNVETNEEKWVNSYTLYKYRSLGLLN